MALTSNETTNAAEFTVPAKSTTNKLKKIGLWILYIGAPLILLVILTILMKGYEGYAIGIFLIVMVPLYYCNLLPKFIVPFTQIYSEISYEYALKQGQFLVNTIYGSESSKFKKRKPLLEAITVSKAEKIAPYTPEYAEMVKNNQFDVVYNAIAEENHPDNYVLIFTNEEGKKCIVLFQNIKKMLKAMSFLNAEHTETKTLTL